MNVRCLRHVHFRQNVEILWEVLSVFVMMGLMDLESYATVIQIIKLNIRFLTLIIFYNLQCFIVLVVCGKENENNLKKK